VRSVVLVVQWPNDLFSVVYVGKRAEIDTLLINLTY